MTFDVHANHLATFSLGPVVYTRPVRENICRCRHSANEHPACDHACEPVARHLPKCAPLISSRPYHCFPDPPTRRPFKSSLECSPAQDSDASFLCTTAVESTSVFVLTNRCLFSPPAVGFDKEDLSHHPSAVSQRCSSCDATRLWQDKAHTSATVSPRSGKTYYLAPHLVRLICKPVFR